MSDKKTAENSLDEAFRALESGEHVAVRDVDWLEQYARHFAVGTQPQQSSRPGFALFSMEDPSIWVGAAASTFERQRGG